MTASRADPAERLYLITDRQQARDGGGSVETAVDAALAAGVRLIQFRDKSLPADERLALGRRVAELCADRDATLLVNGRADLARCLCADGVHRPSSGLPVGCLRSVLGGESVVGTSAHDRSELEEAASQTADFATLSPVWPSPSKPNYGPTLGVERFEELVDGADVPVYALGGVSPERVEACLAAGARGVAVMSGVMAADDPGRAAAAYLRAIEEALEAEA